MRGVHRIDFSRVTVGLLALFAFALTSPPVFAGQGTTEPPLKHMTVNLHDKAALRQGAVYFAHQCLACHSLQGVRFAELARPLGLTKKQMQESINTTGIRWFDTITSPMPVALIKKFLHAPAPDLTVISKIRGVDWLYTYLTSFYVDPTRFTGANNVVFYNTAMPDVFADLQGLQAPVKKMGYRYSQRLKIAVGVRPLTKGTMTPVQFDRMAKDIVTFLYYVGYPHEQESHKIGLWVLGWLAGLTVLAYILYKLYWRRVIRPEGGRWWSYWKH